MSEEQEFKKQGVISSKTQKWLADKKRKEEEAKNSPAPKPKQANYCKRRAPEVF